MGFHVKKSGSVGNIGGNSREKSGIQKVLNSPQDPSRNDRPGIYPPGAPRKRSHSWRCSGPLDFACAYHPEGTTVIMKGHTPVWGPKRAMYPALQHLPHRSKQPQNGFAYCQYHEQGLCQIALESRKNSALNGQGLTRCIFCLTKWQLHLTKWQLTNPHSIKCIFVSSIDISVLFFSYES